MRLESYCPVQESTRYLMDSDRHLVPPNLIDWVESNFVYIYIKLNYLSKFGEPFLASSHLGKLFPAVNPSKCLTSEKFDVEELRKFIPDLRFKFDLDETYLPIDFVLHCSSATMHNTLLLMFCEKLVRLNLEKYFSCEFSQAYKIIKKIADEGSLAVDSEFMWNISYDAGYFLVNCSLVEKNNMLLSLSSSLRVNELEESVQKEIDRYHARKEFLIRKYSWLLELRQEWNQSRKLTRLYDCFR